MQWLSDRTGWRQLTRKGQESNLPSSSSSSSSSLLLYVHRNLGFITGEGRVHGPVGGEGMNVQLNLLFHAAPELCNSTDSRNPRKAHAISFLPTNQPR